MKLEKFKKTVLACVLVSFLLVYTGCEGTDTDRTDTMLGGVLAGALVLSQAGAIIQRQTDYSQAEANTVYLENKAEQETPEQKAAREEEEKKAAANEAGPDIPQNPQPPDKASEIPGKTEFTWEVENYEFGFMTFDFYFDTRPEPVKIISKDQYYPSFTMSGLSTARIYYWKVTARDPEGREKTSPVWSFSTAGYVAPEENVAPDIPSNPFPDDNSSYQPLDMTLSWKSEDKNEKDIVSYTLYLDTKDNPAKIEAQNIKENLYSLKNLEKNQAYFWKVVSKDTSGLTSTGPVWSFTTGNGSLARMPSNPQPPDKKVFTDTLPIELAWTGGSTDESPVRYNLYFGDNENSLNLFSGITETKYPLQGITYEKTYYWKIQALDEADIPMAGPVWSFSAQKSLTPEALPEKTKVIDFYYSQGCPYCRDEEVYLTFLEELMPDTLKINRYDTADNRDRFLNLSNTLPGYSNPKNAVPVTIINNNYMIGFSKDTGPATIDSMLRN